VSKKEREILKAAIRKGKQKTKKKKLHAFRQEIKKKFGKKLENYWLSIRGARK
jgi:hypothetical protein